MSRTLSARLLDNRTLGGANRYVSEVVADSPFAYFRLNDLGGPVADYMGGAGGTVNGNLIFGLPGAIDDGTTAIGMWTTSTSNYIDLPVTFNYDVGLSAEWWIQGWHSGNNSVPLRDAGNSDLFFLLDSGGTIRYRLDNRDVDTGVSSASYLLRPDFVHMVVTATPTTTAFYINGAQVYSNAITTLTGTSAGPMRLFRSGSTNNPSPCTLAEVAFYDHALAPARVAAHYAAAQ